MINCPLQNGEKFLLNWIQTRPVITQEFGERPEVYKQFGLNGHNGIDFRAAIGTQLFAPIEGVATIGDEGSGGYGKYIKITKDNLEVTIGHLSEFQVSNGQQVYLGDKIAKSGNSGFSTGPHVHLTVKFRKDGKISDKGNGYKGAIDPTGLIITWKGTLTKFTL